MSPSPLTGQSHSILPDEADDATSVDGSQSDREAVFVLEYVKSGDAMAAASKAGICHEFYPVGVAAERLLMRPDIKAAIATVQSLERQVIPIDITRSSIMSDLQNVYEAAMKDRSYSSAISSKKLQAALMGLLEQKINISHNYNVSEMTDEDLMKIVNQNDHNGSRDRQVIDVDVDDM